jgi:hypothetical protein
MQRVAFEKLEEMAGLPKEMTHEVLSYRIAKKLASTEAAPGGRIKDLMTSKAALGALPFIGYEAGKLVGGEKGGEVGATLGALGTAQAFSPEVISKVLFPVAKEAGVKMLPTARAAISKLISNPATRRALFQLLTQAEGAVGEGVQNASSQQPQAPAGQQSMTADQFQQMFGQAPASAPTQDTSAPPSGAMTFDADQFDQMFGGSPDELSYGQTE